MLLELRCHISRVYSKSILWSSIKMQIFNRILKTFWWLLAFISIIQMCLSDEYLGKLLRFEQIHNITSAISAAHKDLGRIGIPWGKREIFKRFMGVGNFHNHVRALALPLIPLHKPSSVHTQKGI